MPMELGLELVTPIGSDRVDSEGELLDDVIDEVDGVRLGVAAIDLQGADTRSVIDGCVLIATHRHTLFPL